MVHPIELEVRAELSLVQIPRVQAALEARGFVLKNTTRRTMLMSFSRIGRIDEDTTDHKVEPEETDIRCRITNGSAEVVVKLGGVHAHDRREVSTPVTLEQLPQFARVIGAMNMFHKVGSRRTINLQREQVTAAIVSSPSGLAYLELEKMSDDAHAEGDRRELETIARELQITLISDRAAFIDLCKRLDQQDDWEFHGTEEDIERFLEEIRRTEADRTEVQK